MKRGIHTLELIRQVENWLVAIGLFLMALFPLIEIGSRVMGIVGLTGTTDYVRHLTLWIGFLGAMLTAREGRHLSIHTGIDALPERLKRIIRISTTVVATAVCASLAWAGLEFVRSEYSSPTQIAGWIPQWVAIIIIPIGFSLVTLRLIWRSSDHWSGRIISATGPILAIVIGFFTDTDTGCRSSHPRNDPANHGRHSWKPYFFCHWWYCSSTLHG